MSCLRAAVTITWGIKYRNTPSHLQGTYSKNLQSNTSRVWDVKFCVKSTYSSNFGGFSNYTSNSVILTLIVLAEWAKTQNVGEAYAQFYWSKLSNIQIQTNAKLWVTFRTTISPRILSQKHFLLVSNLLCSNALHFLFIAHLPIRKTYFQLPRLWDEFVCEILKV